MTGGSFPWSRIGLLVLVGIALAVTVLAVQRYRESDGATERLDAVATRLSVEQRSSPVAASGTGEPEQGRGDSRRGAEGDDDGTRAAQAVMSIRQRRLFAPAPPEAFREVQGVLGNRVLYPGGQSFTVGEDAMGAKIVAVGSDWVQLEHEGKTIRIQVFQNDGRGGGGGGGGGGEMRGGGTRQSYGNRDGQTRGERQRGTRGERSRREQQESSDPAPAE